MTNLALSIAEAYLLIVLVGIGLAVIGTILCAVGSILGGDEGK